MFATIGRFGLVAYMAAFAAFLACYVTPQWIAEVRSITPDTGLLDIASVACGVAVPLGAVITAALAVAVVADHCRHA